jgi:serine/threonine protein kinase
MGSVYLAHDAQLDRPVALKILENIGRTGGQAVARFRREARAVARVVHPRIMQIYDIGEQDDLIFLALEYVGGGSLSSRLRNEGPMSLEAAARLVQGLAQAVQAAHEQGVIHRDLKPSNILMTEDGQAKIADFGLALPAFQIEADEVATIAGQPIGTPSYMAPEQVRGDRERIEATTDVYGLGAILYECLTQRRPFQGDSTIAMLHKVLNESPAPPRQIRPEIPEPLERICLKCLQKDPGRRYASAGELARALKQFLRGRGGDEPAEDGETPPRASPPPPDRDRGDPVAEDRPGPWDRVRRWWAGRNPSRPPGRSGR